MRSLLFASLLFAGACGQAYADQPTIAAPQAMGPRTALAIAPAKTRAPYDVQVIRESGEALPTYAFKDRFYVQGDIGQRYIIRVTNPTANRVEAVVSVDGLDVIDGDSGDLRKRGYIVPPYGDVRIEGFRTSLDDVATFRFSSVDGSYAGAQGKARNVGVIAVAIFEEQGEPPQQVIVQSDQPPPPPRRADKSYDYRDDLDASRSAPPAPRPTTTTTAHAAPKKSMGPSGGAAASPSAPPPVASSETRAKDSNYADDEGGGDYERAPEPTHRPGLGTEFGESRSSGATYTRFVRAANAPVAVAELRYNDTAGLAALGIPVQPTPDPGELMTRETADPFPGDQRFAQPPR
ncbi:MAG TPA: hypothetical protein VMJ10_23565 [Kofleriaceae bacterium]|nr:hypothetical protein [Kofleriaceae bacterium]